MPVIQRTALVTGANRGLGLEVCRQLIARQIRLILTSRNEAKGKAAVAKLKKSGAEVFYYPLDVASPESIEALRKSLLGRFGAVDVLVNNAAVLLDEDADILDVDPEIFRSVMDTNFYGPLWMCQAFVPQMIQHGYGRVVNVSSGAGQVDGFSAGMTAPSYKLSKLALNGLTRLVARQVQGTRVLVNAACPGWVRTEMGGTSAPRSVELGADTIVWLATLPDNGPNGGFFRDRKRIDW